MTKVGVTGNVLRIEKSSIYDGDGLRTVLFLKGCPLRCLWCSTPESQIIAPERGLISEKCISCGLCVKECPVGALELAEGKIRIDRRKCTGCFKCAEICPASAISCYGKQMSVEEVVHEISKDEVFYFHSGGGLTVSGGEPLDQSDFVREVLRECYELGIECAIETSFFGKWEKIESLLPYINLLHVDIKHIDDKKHKELAGVSNALILDNIIRADNSSYDFDLVIRTPLVPGINDSDEDLEKLAAFVKELKKLRFVEFLAYHRLGTETYRRLEIDYPLSDIKTPDTTRMRGKAAVFKKVAPDVPVKINGVALKTSAS